MAKCLLNRGLGCGSVQEILVPLGSVGAVRRLLPPGLLERILPVDRSWSVALNAKANNTKKLENNINAKK
jgi:hypothetical protein